jgi:hypothetical protein
MLGEAQNPRHWIVVAVPMLLARLLSVHVMGKFRHRIVYWF